MGKHGKISSIKKEYNGSLVQTMESSLAARGMARVPGTGVFMYPYKEIDGQYRTGLDPNASYIKRIQDPTEKELEITRVTELRKRLEASLGDVDLGPRSKFWNYSLSTSDDDMLHVKPAKLMDGDNMFDFSNIFQELTFSWLRVHPRIASSLQAYNRGEYPSETTQFYVADDEIENAIIFKKKQLINKAVAKFDSMTPEKRRKVARLLGLPVTEDTKEEVVYNLVDTMLKQTELKSGNFKGLNPVEVFGRFADMKEDLLHIKDLVEQALTHSIYRRKDSGRIFEGELEIAPDKEELVKRLIDDDHQDELIILEKKLKTKKLASV